MTEDDKAVIQFYEMASAGDQDAMNFLRLFHAYSHSIDDLLDLKQFNPETLLKVLANANIVYSSPFYSRHAHRLHLVIANVTNAFADSIAWARSRDEWKKQWADTLRFSGNEMVLAVAMICGGFGLMRQMSPLLKELSWQCHHGEGEKPE